MEVKDIGDSVVEETSVVRDNDYRLLLAVKNTKMRKWTNLTCSQ